MMQVHDPETGSIIDYPNRKLIYLYYPYRCVISKFSSYILSNTKRRIVTRTHYIGDMFRGTFFAK
jgi:hypothetical protein